MKVTAIESIKDGVMRSYGDGELIEDQIPDTSPFNEAGIHNPCILLESGKYVWGFQCWWGEADAFKAKYGDRTKETTIVEPSNIQPLESNRVQVEQMKEHKHLNSK